MWILAMLQICTIGLPLMTTRTIAHGPDHEIVSYEDDFCLRGARLEPFDTKEDCIAFVQLSVRRVAWTLIRGQGFAPQMAISASCVPLEPPVVI